MPKSHIIAGQRFGRLVAIEPETGSRWRCQCDCGNATVATRYALTRNRTKSCGCLKPPPNRKHGWTGTPTHDVWLSMKRRCYYPNDKRYARYGARGITVCERWRGEYGFENFLADMGPCQPSMQLDRIDNDGDYEPSNCRWATRSQQMLNRGLFHRKSGREIMNVLAKADRPLSPKDVAAITGMLHVTVKSSLRHLANMGEVKRVSRGLYSVSL